MSILLKQSTTNAFLYNKSTQFQHLSTRFSRRSHVMKYLWYDAIFESSAFWPGNTVLDTLPTSIYYELLLQLTIIHNLCTADVAISKSGCLTKCACTCRHKVTVSRHQNYSTPVFISGVITALINHIQYLLSTFRK